MNTLSTFKVTGLTFSIGSICLLLILLFLQDVKGKFEVETLTHAATVQPTVGNNYALFMQSFYRMWQDDRGTSVFTSKRLLEAESGAKINSVLLETNEQNALITASFERGAW